MDSLHFRHCTNFFLFQDMKPHVSKVTALFLLSQVFLIITHVPLVRLLAWIIFAGDANIFTERGAARIAEYSSTSRKKTPNFLTVSEKRKKNSVQSWEFPATLILREIKVDESETLHSPKSISRKIWVTEKSLTFHTVKKRGLRLCA